MHPESHNNFLAVTRKQLILVAVLAVVLVAVLVMNFAGGSSASATTRPRGRPAARPAGTKAGSTKATTGDSASHRHTWPIAQLAEALRHNPFSVPPEMIEQLRGETAASGADADHTGPEPPRDPAKALAHRQITAIIGGPSRGYVAIVDSQTIRPGDLLDGFRVVAIQPDGVLLDPHPVVQSGQSNGNTQGSSSQDSEDL